ncbi:uncharacterized protein YdaU (DUF1376 family) [Paenochrobactrum gallinarii]|uniref:Uncharacterized protein YdaU (DUF1376 family) n=1 Tax=Paenochrobactrum gallinarii TaxID=643673 RepID=A0A841M7A8_9HYPH|nr:DUF1376 domain-containing protein [Paenochrobactrum gallinarii]MBB6262141.1 uncharacterized protein YdaU (DUF1376 family) [Paenochrobactrum gallinarii]
MSRNRIPYFDFYPSDFMHGVRGLSAQEVGVYTMLLCRIYEENGPVEFHIMRLSTYCGMRENTFTKVVDKLVDLGKLDLVDGMLSNHRAEVEISSRANKLKNNSKAGKASAEKRQQKQRLVSTNVQQPFNHTDTDTDNTSSLRSDVSVKSVDQEFENEFWPFYPRKVGKGQALGSGTFLIDHPLDPANKNLRHGFVEAPEYVNIYRGVVRLVNGKAAVNIDDYFGMVPGTFSALNADIMISSLQNQEGGTVVWPDGKMTGGILNITCADETCNDEIAWMVTGRRKDAFVLNLDPNCERGTGRFIPEVDKEA